MKLEIKPLTGATCVFPLYVKDVANRDIRSQSPTATVRKRKMVSAELMGAHSHSTTTGINVHIYKREDNYIARGRYEGENFGQTLGNDLVNAQASLRQILSEIESGAFLRPSEAKKRPLKKRKNVRLTLTELCNEFLKEKRKLRGQKTMKDYKNRLVPAIEFSHLPSSLKHWNVAAAIDRHFVIAYREFLIRREVHRNGRGGSEPKPMSIRQVSNCLEMLKTLLAWASRGDILMLPPDFVNPVTKDIVGKIPAKDPLRQSKLPMSERIKLVEQMDDWQFLTLSILMVLPLRFEDVSGAIISDIDFEQQALRLGSRFDGSDFNKGKVNVQMPLPPELLAIFKVCRQCRTEGPIFLKRPERYKKMRKITRLESPIDLTRLYNERLRLSKPDQIQSEQDRKLEFRKLLLELGGFTSSYLGKQIKALIPPGANIRPYDLRGSITQEMKQAGIAHLELRYLTEHSVNDIINEYSGLSPQDEMQKYYSTIQPLLQTIGERLRTISEEDAWKIFHG